MWYCFVCWFARTVACPRTGKTVPFFELARDTEIVFDPKRAGTWNRGKGVSPWDHMTIDADYIKAEAQAGRMGEMLYAVAIRTAKGRDFRTPHDIDLKALAAAKEENVTQCNAGDLRHLADASQTLVCMDPQRADAWDGLGTGIVS